MSWLPKKLVVVPVDFSDASFDSLSTALTLVDEPGHVHAIHVLPELPVTEPGVIWDTVDDESRIQHGLKAMSKRLGEKGFDKVKSAIAIGDPGHEATRYAKNEGADVIVVSSRGRSGIKDLLMGSVTERVIRFAHCPVLVVK